MARVADERKALVVLCAGFALFFLFLEVLKAERSSQWAGILPGDWLGLGFGLVVYGLVLAGLALAGRFLLLRAQLGPSAVLAMPPVLLPGVGAVVWGLLSIHREYTPTLDDGIVALVLAGSGAALGLGLWRGWWTVGGFGFVLVFAWLSGLAGLYGAGEYFLFHPARSRIVTVYPAVWLGLSALLLVVVLRWRPRLLAPVGIGLAAAPVLLA